MLTVRVGTVQAGKKKHTAYIGYRRGSFCLRVYNVLHWLLPANYQEGFCGPVFLRNKQHGSQVLGIRCHQPQSPSSTSKPLQFFVNLDHLDKKTIMLALYAVPP